MAYPKIDQAITFLYTADLEATAAFYEDLLGLPLVADQGRCRIYGVCGDAYVGFCQRAGLGIGDQPNIILTLVTAEVDAWYERLAAQGTTVVKPPTVNAEFNIYHCFLLDPNGYLVEIQRFLDPAWNRPG